MKGRVEAGRRRGGEGGRGGQRECTITEKCRFTHYSPRELTGTCHPLVFPSRERVTMILFGERFPEKGRQIHRFPYIPPPVRRPRHVVFVPPLTAHHRFAQSCRKVVCQQPDADERLEPDEELRILRREAERLKAALAVRMGVLCMVQNGRLCRG